MAAALVFLLVLLSEAASGSVVRVKSGQDVTLPCRAADASIRAVEWTKAGLEDSVLLYRDDHTNRNPSFKGRVQLEDSKLKNGDVSLILRNVSINDTGTYECRVASTGSRQKRDNPEPKLMRSIQLEVKDGNRTAGYVGLGAGFVLVCLIAAAVFAGWKYKRHTDRKSKANGSNVDETLATQLIT